MSLFGRFRALDVYRDVPKELSEQSPIGGAISLIASLVIGLLFFSELSSWLAGSTTHQLVIEQPHAPPRHSAPHTEGTSSAMVHSIDDTLSVTAHLNMTFYAVGGTAQPGPRLRCPRAFPCLTCVSVCVNVVAV